MTNTINAYKEEMIQSLIEIISIPSIEGPPEPGKPFGKHVDEALNYALSLSEKIGMSVKNVDNYAGYAEFGQGEETLGIVLHLDVVPAGEGWTVPPFEPQRIGDRIYGRGTTDNKGPFIAIMYAIKALIEEKVPLKRKVRVIFGTNEETRWEGIHYYLEKEQAPDFTIVPDALFPIVYAEKGIVDYRVTIPFDEGDIRLHSLTGGNAINSVADTCELVLEMNESMDECLKRLEAFVAEKPFKIAYTLEGKQLKLTCKGLSAHGSEPQTGANAIGYMAHVLTKILDGDTGLQQSMEFIKTYFNHKDYYGLALGIGTEDQPSGKLTNNVGIIDFQDGKINMRVNTRYPVTMDYDKYLNSLKTCVEKEGYEFELEEHLPPVYKSLESQETKILIDTYREISGDDESQPISMGGGTYARAIPNAIAYGGQIQGDPVIPHQDDEYLTIENLMLMANVYVKAIDRLANFQGQFRK